MLYLYSVFRTKEEQITFVNELLVSHASIHYNLVLPTNYLQLSLRAMKHLESVGRCNVLFELAKGLGTMDLILCFPLQGCQWVYYTIWFVSLLMNLGKM